MNRIILEKYTRWLSWVGITLIYDRKLWIPAWLILKFPDGSAETIENNNAALDRLDELTDGAVM